MPEEFNVRLLEHAAEDGAVYGSKAVGEPPLMLAFSVREAIREAVGAFGPTGHSVELRLAGDAPRRCSGRSGGARRADAARWHATPSRTPRPRAGVVDRSSPSDT